MPGEQAARAAVSVILALIALLTFAFSFGNIWALGMRLGVSAWIAPLVGPAVDLSVVGLLVAIRYLSMRGVAARDLRAARCLLVLTGAATLALNVAEPAAEGAYGRATFDAVGPLLMIGWSEVGPGLLRHINAARNIPWAHDSSTDSPSDANGSGQVRTLRTESAAGSVAGMRAGQQRRAREGRDKLLERVRVIDAEHRAQHRGRPVSADTVRRDLRIGAKAARDLVRTVRAEISGPSLFVPSVHGS